MEDTCSLSSLPDDELLRRLSDLLRHSRYTEADLVAHIGEVDARRLYAGCASPSMFAYCTERLHLSEFEAYLRITVARASRRHSLILDMLREGSVHLSGVARLAPHLTGDDAESLLRRAAHRSKREVEELIAEHAPRPDAPMVVRKLPASLQLVPERVESLALTSTASSAGESATTAGPAPEGSRASVPVGVQGSAEQVEPLSPGRYRVQFTASASLRDKLERLRALMRSSVPDGDLAAILEVAVTERLERLEARRYGKLSTRRNGTPAQRSSQPDVLATSDPQPSGSRLAQTSAGLSRSSGTRPPGSRRVVSSPGFRPPSPAGNPPSSRHIPAPVRRAVYERDGGRCRFTDERGRRCTAREGLEFHHRHPFGHGGDHSMDNVSLLCRTHNRLLAEVDYGRALEAHRRPSAIAASVAGSRPVPGATVPTGGA